MHLPHLVPALALAAGALAIVPEGRIVQQSAEDALPGPLSLPNLLDVENVDQLTPNWAVSGGMRLDAGRLVVADGAGALWSTRPLANSKLDWTVELVFRASELEDVDAHNYYDSNGFSLWLLDAAPPGDTLNFGGPRRYDGLQFLVNNKGSKSLKIFANDGSKDAVNAHEHALGGCDINYLDSTVPFSLRVSYLALQKWFKVQIDNNLCFKTEAVTFNNIAGDLYFGASSSTKAESKEYWEIMKLDVYDSLTADAIDDHGIISGGSIKYVTVTNDAQPTSTPQQNRNSLMEKTRQLREQLTRNLNTQQRVQFDSAQFDSLLGEIASKLAGLEAMLNKVDDSKVGELANAVKEIKSIQNEQLAVLGELKNTYDNFESLLATQYKEMLQSIGALHEEVIEEIKSHQKEVHGISSKVDLLMSNHKEIRDQYALDSANDTDISQFFNAVVKWVLFPIVIGIAALAAFVYRLRKDIKHSKLL